MKSPAELSNAALLARLRKIVERERQLRAERELLRREQIARAVERRRSPSGAA